MTRKTYTLEELLALRAPASQYPLECKILHQVERDPSIAHVLRVRPTAPLTNGVNRSIGKHHVSTESDEPIRQQLDGQEVEWKLRERNAVEAQSPNPLMAPHEMTAQMNEGFKRFYKAVVSPNNIRVTAGGRIVPNTLPHSSPTGKGKDKENGEGPFRFTVQGHQNYSASSNGGFPVHRRDSVFSPSLVPRSPRPMSATPFLMPNYASSAAPAVPDPANTAPSADASKMEDGGRDKNVTKAPLEEPLAPKPSGPHMPGHYMGHAFMPGMPGMPMPMSVQMPVPMGMSMPMPMIPSHPSMTGHPGSQMGTMGPHMGAFSPIYGPMPFQNGHLHHPMPMPFPGLVQPFPNLMGGPHGPLHAPSAPPTSSIRMSHVTRKHIENMRLQLRWVEDQLQFNKHQVDEKEMKQQAEVIRRQIQELEANLKCQLEDEARQSKTGSKSASTKPSIRELAVQARGSTQSNCATSESKPSTGKRSTQAFHGKERGNRARASGSRQNTDHYRTSTTDSNPVEEPAPMTTSALVLHDANMHPEPVKKRSALPITAALAPPFKPRGQYGQGVMHSASIESVKYTASSRMSEEERLAREQRLLAAGMQYPPITPEFEAMSARLSDATLRRPEKEDESSADIQSGSQGNSQEPLDQLNDGLGQPYLEGKLRPGVDARDAKDQDYIYPRPLTDEEIRARHLYWGNAPRSVQKGLPKYDGRNFYPASPVKELKSPDADSNRTNLPGSRLDGYDYESQSSVPGPDPDPFIQETMRGLIALHLSKSRRQTQSDNVNGGLSPKKKPIRIRPATSLASKDETSDSDQTRDFAEESEPDHALRQSNQLSDSDESQVIVFNGRRNAQRSRYVPYISCAHSPRRLTFMPTSNNRSRLWQTMGKINAGSVNALPGAMSSTTAHGLLRQYAGSAAASLTPAMVTASVSAVSPRISPVRIQGEEETPAGAALFGDKRENKSPLGRR
ncbi:hypothetical protein ACRALDRAFT_2023750 [Sodiomyces alcalophilus JCM 7366]|uniref:uncharacterized protein n=1 Tax=Sodiomyces alcalophilus JCM 7366 TaxID=591952 RepID=UPI0039B65C6C